MQICDGNARVGPLYIRAQPEDVNDGENTRVRFLYVMA
jgi:hypothetical protein